MLTKTEFDNLYASKGFDQINEEYANATTDDKAILLKWLGEAKSAEEALAEIGETLKELNEQEELESQAGADARRVSVSQSLETAELSPEEKQRQANILRAKRANLKRRISKKFRPYIPFTASQAAEAIGVNAQMLENYLRSEASVPGREIVAVPEVEAYMLIDLFA